MEFKVERVIWYEDKAVPEKLITKYIYLSDIMTIEQGSRDSKSTTDVVMSWGETMVVNESVKSLYNRFEQFKTEREDEAREQERRDDLGLDTDY